MDALDQLSSCCRVSLSAMNPFNKILCVGMWREIAALPGHSYSLFYEEMKKINEP